MATNTGGDEVTEYSDNEILASEAYLEYETISKDGNLCMNIANMMRDLDNLRLQVAQLTAELAEWKAENDRLASLLHDINSQLEIATDLGDKRWRALNDIYLNGEKHNANWCKRKAQEGLGIKNG